MTKMIVCLIQLLLNCSVYLRIFTMLVCSSLTIGQFEGNKYMKSEVISLISHIGPTMCTNKCKSLYGCNGVNFDRQQLTCELLRIHAITDEMSEKDGSMFAALSSLPSMNAAACWPNPCSENNKCIVSRQNKAFCISAYGELFFMKTIMSTNYPGYYPNYNVQSWTLSVVGNSSLVLKFKAFAMENNNDFLKIYDIRNGTELYRFTGHNIPDNIWSNETTLFITFTSDQSFTYTGFYIDIYQTA